MKGVAYVAAAGDPVDIAVLEIDPVAEIVPLEWAIGGDETVENLYVVGHPAPLSEKYRDVEAVFGRPDGRKRVSFGDHGGRPQRRAHP